MGSSDDWSAVRDLALIYSGLACVDRELTDEEVEMIKKVLQEWIPWAAETTAPEVVKEAARTLQRSQGAVRQAIERVGRQFDEEERRKALRGLLRIAEADGVLFERERDVIHDLADAWELKTLGDDEEADHPVLREGQGDDWTLIHEIAFLFVQGTRGEVSERRAKHIVNRLREWRPDLAEEDLHRVLRRAREAAEEHPGEPLSPESVGGLEEALSRVQQLLVLDDLHAVQRAEGPLPRDERRMLLSLAESWDMNVRLEEGE